MKKNYLFLFGLLFFAATLGIAQSRELLELYPPLVRKGDSTIIRIHTSVAPRVRLGLSRIPMYRTKEGSYMGFLAIDIQDSRKKDYLEVRYGNKVAVFTLQLAEAVYRTRKFTIPPVKQKYVGPSKAKTKANETVNSVRQKSSAVLFLEDSFTLPIKGARRNDLFYGDYRVITSGKSTVWYFHRGIDFAALKGTPVYACNSGVVRLARKLFSRGNAVIIDHGWGVYTEYLHLNKILVKEGDILLRGQKLGEVGNTGVSTGPHLHLSVLVNGVLVNPFFWMRPVVAELFPGNPVLSLKTSEK